MNCKVYNVIRKKYIGKKFTRMNYKKGESHMNKKEKYLVVVNSKYVLTIESTSLGGAEHVILDQCYYGIKQCQAFNLSDSKLLFEMFPDVETTNFYAVLKISKLTHAHELRMQAKQMLAEADQLIEKYATN